MDIEKHRDAAIRSMIKGKEKHDGKYTCKICNMKYKHLSAAIKHVCNKHDMAVKEETGLLVVEERKKKVVELKESLPKFLSSRIRHLTNELSKFINEVGTSSIVRNTLYYGTEAVIKNEYKLRFYEEVESMWNREQDWEKRYDELNAMVDTIKRKIVSNPPRFSSTSLVANMIQLLENEARSELVGAFGTVRMLQNGMKTLLRCQGVKTV